MARFVAMIAEWDALQDVGYSSSATHWAEDKKTVALRTALDRQAFTEYSLEAESVGEVFEILNIRHPADYRNRSMSVGDLCLANVEGPGETKVYRCDPCGWTDVTDIVLPPTSQETIDTMRAVATDTNGPQPGTYAFTARMLVAAGIMTGEEADHWKDEMKDQE